MQDVDSMGDSQIRDIRVAYANEADHAIEQIKLDESDSAWTPSPPQCMRDNPFRVRRLFWSGNEGSPSAPNTDQIKLKRESPRISESVTANNFARSK